MVIENFLALSVIALGLTVPAADAQPAGRGSRRTARAFRRRVRWLRQHLPARTGGAAASALQHHPAEGGEGGE